MITTRDCKPRWDYPLVGVGNPKLSKSNLRNHGVAQLAFTPSFAYKTHLRGKEPLFDYS